RAQAAAETHDRVVQLPDEPKAYGIPMLWSRPTPRIYMALWPFDVAAAGVDARTHFDSFGWHEGRNPNAWLDTAGYLAHYADVAAGGANPLQHYEQFGWKEGRDPSAG